MRSTRAVRSLAVLFLMLAFQVSVFAHVRPFGIAADLLLTAAVVGSIVGGPDYGAKNGFAAGLFLDLVVPGAFGLAAGVYGLVGYGVGAATRALDPDDPRVLPVLVGVSTFLATTAYGLGLGVLGSEQFVSPRLLATALGVSIFSVLLTRPVRDLYQWVLLGVGEMARTDTGATVLN